MRIRHAGRRGLTLIELLVVIAIIVVLLAIVAVVGPHFSERQRTTRGATQLQGWFMIAKQRALRDGAPRGIRLVPPPAGDPSYRQYVTQLQYIEQPDAYTPATLDGAGNVVGGSLSIQADFQQLTVQFPGAADPNGAAAQAFNALWPEKANDPSTAIRPDVVLDLYGRYPGQPRRVVDIQYSAGSPILTLVLDRQLETPPPPSAPPPTTEYRFYRKAQPIAGEPILQMPKDIAIDISRDPGPNISWYRTFPKFNTGGTQPFDILFDQTGQVIGPAGRQSNRICLWVRDVSNNRTGPTVSNDPNATDPFYLPPGENTLITIYTRTGLIAVHPIDDGVNPATGISRLQPDPPPPGTPTWNPFYFTQDGRSSGM